MFRKNKYLGIITGDVVTAGPGENALNLARLMKKNGIGVVVIVENGDVKGTVSERDIVRGVVAAGMPVDKAIAGDFMTKDVIAVQIKDGLNNIYKTLCEMKFRYLVVLDDKELVGITSRKDLLDVLVKKGGQ